MVSVMTVPLAFRVSAQYSLPLLCRLAIVATEPGGVMPPGCTDGVGGACRSRLGGLPMRPAERTPGILLRTVE